MKERIYGIETEYAYYFTKKDERYRVGSEQLLDSIRYGLISTDNSIIGFLRTLFNFSVSSQFLSNGARLYEDRNAVIEYATPECRDAKTLIACDKAGEKLLSS